MISRLEIKGFKSLVDVSIELGSVNVFVGANGSGKSNLLEAVGVLSAITSGQLNAESTRYRGVRSGNPSSFLSSFPNQSRSGIESLVEDDRTRFRVEYQPDEENPSSWSITHETLDHDGTRYLDRGQELTISQRHNPDAHEKIKIDFTNFDKSFSATTIMPIFGFGVGSESRSRFLDYLPDFSIFSPTTPQLRGHPGDILKAPLGLGGSGLGRAINDMLKSDPKKLGPFDLGDVFELIDWADALVPDVPAISNGDTPIRLRLGDRFMAGQHKSVSLIEASEGAPYVLFLLALVGHERSPKIFAIDNFDQALHPRLARALTRLISEQILDDGSRQMLATTHNPLVLDGLDLLDDRIRLFTVDRDPTGASQVRRVRVTPELMAQAENGFSLSQLWTMGRFGGVPKNF